VSPLPSYTLLALSLGGIFAAGGTVGYLAGKRPGPAQDPAISTISTTNSTSPEQWADQAFENLAGDLKLTAPQRLKMRPFLLEAAGKVFMERDRALFQMHLRLLEAHDTLASESNLDPSQQKRLKQSRDKLKASISARFADILRDNPSAVPEL